MTMLLIASMLVMFVAGFVIGDLSKRRPPLARSIPPPSLAEHVATFREIVSASGEMTPEVEAWLAQVSQEQKALPGANKDELRKRHCIDEDDDLDESVDNWNHLLADLTLESVEEDKVEALRAWITDGQVFTGYEYVQIVSMFTKAENRKIVRSIMSQSKPSETGSETDEEVSYRVTNS